MENQEIDFKSIEKKWQAKWSDAKLFEPEPTKDKPKFFLTFPYPYVNGYSHLGHLYTITKIDVFARYKRLNGFNVLFPQAWHCTGSPIVNAAQRIAENEPKQVKIMYDMGFSKEEIKKFEDPEYWIKFFPKEFKKDYQDAGLSIDFRREFITTSLNAHYDKFIRWQFNKLKEKNYVIKGKHPVVWCPKENCPISDHARIEGEGETPQEFTLLKFKFKEPKEFIIAATLRPETVFGQTNLWISPDSEYVKAKVNDEVWIVSKPCTEKLKEQDKTVEIVGKIKGSELLGKYVTAPGINRQIIILPSMFCNQEKGTGIVTSVPSDAPDDWMGLYDLQKDDTLAKKYNLDYNKIKEIKPMPIIDSDDLGNMPAVKVCQEMKITSQLDREKLEEAKKIVYKKGFYSGIMNENCGKYSSVPVERAKDLVKEDLIKNHQADRMYELTGKVVCRCLTNGIVKIVSDQWFINYSNPVWKQETHTALDKLKLYPELIRPQFNYVIDWLNDWACTREFGLGTRLPWDEKWLIESLSDSTLYPAYYTIAHLIKNIPIENVDDKLFDYVFLNKGKKPEIESVDEMKENFEYWYSVDFRASGKDLVQNHLTFYLFNHVAIFPQKYWPKGISVNGHITVDGQKMSKSLGNFLLMRDLVSKGADASRFAAIWAGEGIDDANWDSEFFNNSFGKMQQFKDFSINYYNHQNSVKSVRNIDRWLESKLNSIIKQTTEAMELINFRTAMQLAFFDIQREIKWYLKRTNNTPNQQLMQKIINTQLIMASPVIPHICEEIWEIIGNKNFVTQQSWPKVDEEKINKEYDFQEDLISSAMDDIRAIKQLLKLDSPKEIELIISEGWKYEFYKLLIEKAKDTRNTGDILKALMQTDLRKYGGEITRLIPKLLAKLPSFVLSQNQELNVLSEAKKFLETEFNAIIKITKAEDLAQPQASNITAERDMHSKGELNREFKAKQALPGKPAILMK